MVAGAELIVVERRRSGGEDTSGSILSLAVRALAWRSSDDDEETAK
jgi:hypothetical protein